MGIRTLLDGAGGGGAEGGRADAASLVLFSDHDPVKGQMVKEANVFSN